MGSSQTANENIDKCNNSATPLSDLWEILWWPWWRGPACSASHTWRGCWQWACCSTLSLPDHGTTDIVRLNRPRVHLVDQPRVIWCHTYAMNELYCLIPTSCTGSAASYIHHARVVRPHTYTMHRLNRLIPTPCMRCMCSNLHIHGLYGLIPTPCTGNTASYLQHAWVVRPCTYIMHILYIVIPRPCTGVRPHT